MNRVEFVAPGASVDLRFTLGLAKADPRSAFEVLGGKLTVCPPWPVVALRRAEWAQDARGPENPLCVP